MTTLTNPGPRGRYATIEDVTYGTDKPGGKVHTTNALHATCLVEAGFVMDPDEYEAALDAAASRARDENSKGASASASEGEILTRQATVDVESGATTATPDVVDAGTLKGEALSEALRARGLSKGATADESRNSVAMYDVARASGLYRVGDDGLLELDDSGQYVKVDEGDGFQRDADGELVLDSDGAPIPVEGS